MSDDEKELLVAFNELIPENQASALAYLHIARVSQENTQKVLGEKLNLAMSLCCKLRGSKPDFRINAMSGTTCL